MKTALTLPRLLLFCLLGVMTSACNKNSTQSTSPSVDQPSSKRYHLKGKVVSIDKQAKMANIDAEAIPGFMDAMTMPYEIRPAAEIDKLHPGDAVTADVVVQNDSAWLENVTVTSQSASGPKNK